MNFLKSKFKFVYIFQEYPSLFLKIFTHFKDFLLITLNDQQLNDLQINLKFKVNELVGLLMDGFIMFCDLKEGSLNLNGNNYY